MATMIFERWPDDQQCDQSHILLWYKCIGLCYEVPKMAAILEFKTNINYVLNFDGSVLRMAVNIGIATKVSIDC